MEKIGEGAGGFQTLSGRFRRAVSSSKADLGHLQVPMRLIKPINIVLCAFYLPFHTRIRGKLRVSVLCVRFSPK